MRRFERDWGQLGMKFDIEKRVAFNAPLQVGDTEDETHGCRHTNPDICGSSYLEGVCAFTRNDNICKKPSTAWKKQYTKLLFRERGFSI